MRTGEQAAGLNVGDLAGVLPRCRVSYSVNGNWCETHRQPFEGHSCPNGGALMLYGREQGPWRFARGRAGSAKWHGLVRPVPLDQSVGCRVPAACGHGAVYAWADFDDRVPRFGDRCATCQRMGLFRS